MAIKRTREEFELAMANYLILLSRSSNPSPYVVGPTNTARVYECKTTCNRQFPSFQALGGHRASHKKPRSSDPHNDQDRATQESAIKKPKSHECSICGLEFPIGQALGGHMRRHRAALNNASSISSQLPTLSLSLETSSSYDHHHHRVQESISVMKNKSMSISGDDDHHKSVVCLDLNLTPLENGLLEFGKMAPIVC